VFHRLLDYYSTMAAQRREADRRIKRGRPRKFIEASYIPSEKSQRFQEIADAVRELKNIDCGCPRREWRAELKGKPGAKIHILHRCMACDCQEETILTREEFIKIAQAVL
jgi:hypothetical protein